MQILVVLPRFPYPLDKGDKLRAFNQVKYLSEKHKVTLCCLTDEIVEKQDLEVVEALVDEFHLFKQNKLSIYFNLLIGVLKLLPFQISYYTSRKMKSCIKELHTKSAFDLVYVQLVRMGENIDFDLDIPVYLDYMDAFSVGMKRRAKKSSLLKKIFFRIESFLLTKYEQNILAKVKGASIITFQDKSVVDVSDKIDVIQNGVEVFSENEYEATTKENDIAFLGNMGYFPNVEASKFLVNQILPSLESVNCVIIGKDPSPKVKALEKENVKITGFVNDTKSYLLSSKLFVAPMFTGQGLQNKILESLALGVPVITTSLALKAFPEYKESGIQVADTKEEFVDKISILLKDSDKRRELSRLGVKFIATKYTWSQANKLLEQRLIAVANTR